MQRRPLSDPAIRFQSTFAMARLLPDTRATSALEYAMIAAVIASLLLGTTGLLGGRVLALYNRVLAICPAAHAAPSLHHTAQHLNAAK